MYNFFVVFYFKLFKKRFNVYKMDNGVICLMQVPARCR